MNSRNKFPRNVKNFANAVFAKISGRENFWN